MFRAKKNKKTIGQKIVYTIAFIVIAFFSFSYVYALLWGFVAGLNTNDGLILKPFRFPEVPMWSNYVKIFSELVEAKFLISISSSMPVTITLLVAALAMLLASLSRSPCMSLGVLP